jgi:DNA-directed RNA polymerase beta subunit
MPRVKTDIPLWILFRALGFKRDKDICNLIIGEESDGTFDALLTESINEAADVISQESALAWLSTHVSSWSSRTTKQMRIEDILSLELFPHIGLTPAFNYDKGCFLAHMTRKVIWVASARIPNDDRDAYPNKLVDLPGFLLANLFRTYFTTKMIKDIRSSLAKEIHSGSWRASGNFDDQIAAGSYIAKNPDKVDIDREEKIVRNKIKNRDKLPDEGTPEGPGFLHYPGMRSDADKLKLLEKYKEFA